MIPASRLVPTAEECSAGTLPPNCSARLVLHRRELAVFVARLRELAGGEPAVLGVGSRSEVLGCCRVMLAEGRHTGRRKVWLEPCRQAKVTVGAGGRSGGDPDSDRQPRNAGVGGHPPAHAP